jgi:hypothetical protein
MKHNKMKKRLKDLDFSIGNHRATPLMAHMDKRLLPLRQTFGTCAFIDDGAALPLSGKSLQYILQHELSCIGSTGALCLEISGLWKWFESAYRRG